ncbi:hypothetical protein JCM5350_005960 [Sporobolomyces pararoseus]
MTESSEPPRLKVLSLNCWGLWLVADKRKQRLQAIAEWISNSNSNSPNRNSYHSDSTDFTTTEEEETATASSGGGSGYDIIALQEIWVKSDFDLLTSKAKLVGLEYSKFFYSGCIGSGLGFLSRFPIEESFIKPYTLNGFALNFIQGDFFAGKSICGITIEIPQLSGGGLVEVLNTHMFAPGGEGDRVEAAHRVAQGWELSKLVNEKIERGRHVILTGDFNSQPHSPIIQLLLNHSRLTDSFSQTHPEPPSIHSSQHRSLSPFEVLHTHGITCDSPLNTYSKNKLKNKSPTDEIIIRGGKRLDYIFYRSPTPTNSASNACLKAISCSLKLTEPIPSSISSISSPPISYSDHFALETIFTFVTSPPPPPPPPPEEEEDTSTTTTIELISQASLLLSQSLSQNLSRTRFHLKLFLISLILIPILLVASSFEPLKWLNWLIVLVGILNGAGGMLMLLVGFVAGRWEMGGLKNLLGELEEEVERIKRRRRRRRGRSSW